MVKVVEKQSVPVEGHTEAEGQAEVDEPAELRRETPGLAES